jgi:hypothetical protein
MAKITATQLVLGDSTIISSKYSVVAKNARMVFYQSSAPTGWTVVNITDHVIRVVTGTGGGSGGTLNFSSSLIDYSQNVDVPITFTGLTVGNTSLSTPQIPSHGHNLNGGNTRNDIMNPTPVYTGTHVAATNGTTGGVDSPEGIGQAHTHPITYTNASSPTTLSAQMNVKYSDVLVCNRT